jgi:hypothetical protein
MAAKLPTLHYQPQELPRQSLQLELQLLERQPAPEQSELGEPIALISSCTRIIPVAAEASKAIKPTPESSNIFSEFLIFISSKESIKFGRKSQP